MVHYVSSNLDGIISVCIGVIQSNVVDVSDVVKSVKA